MFSINLRNLLGSRELVEKISSHTTTTFDKRIWKRRGVSVVIISELSIISYFILKMDYSNLSQWDDQNLMAWPLCVHGGIEVGYLVDNLRFAVIFISQTNIKGVSMRHRNVSILLSSLEIKILHTLIIFVQLVLIWIFLDFFYLWPILVQKKVLKRLRYASAAITTFK